MRTHDAPPPPGGGRPTAPSPGGGARDDRSRPQSYDLDLIKGEADRLVAAYLNQPGKASGSRVLWTCPACGKEDKLSLQRSTGAVGCWNASCEVPQSSDVIKLLSHLEGVGSRGEDFKGICALSYRLLGYPDPNAPADGSGHREGEAGGRNGAASAAPPVAPIPRQTQGVRDPAPIADPETVGNVLGRLMALCPLEERDARYLASRGITEETARAGGFGSLSSQRAVHVVGRLEEEFGREELLRVPGFKEDRAGGRLGFTLWGDYLLIPYHGRDGRINTVEGRAATDAQRKRSGGKYISLRRSGNHLYVFPGFAPEDLLALCEGPMGAIVAAQGGAAVGAIQGVKRYMAARTDAGADAPLPELAGVDFAGRALLYVPDVDVKPEAKADVEQHAPRAAEWLIARQNGRALIARLVEGSPKDLDERILAHPDNDAGAVIRDLGEDAVPPHAWSADAKEGGASAPRAGSPVASEADVGTAASPDPQPSGPGRDEAATADLGAAPTPAGGHEEEGPDEHPSARRDEPVHEEEEESDPQSEPDEEKEPDPEPEQELDAYERWYSVLESAAGADRLVGSARVYVPEGAGVSVPSGVFAEDAEVQWSFILGYGIGALAWLLVGAWSGWFPGGPDWLPEPPAALEAYAGAPQAFLLALCLTAAFLFHTRGRRLALRRHLLGDEK